MNYSDCRICAIDKIDYVSFHVVDDFYSLMIPSRTHKYSDIHDTVNISSNCTVWAFTTICRDVILEKDVVIGGRCYIGRNSVIGEGTRIQDGCHITDKMTIGKRCFFGPCVVSMNDRHPVVNNPNYLAEPPIVEDDVVIGAGVVLYPGVRIGARSVIAAGAVVTRDIPSDSVVMIKDRLMITTKT